MPSIKQLTSLPKFTSKEEHAQIVASTPASFADIPPVLQYKEDNVRVVVEPRSRLPWATSDEGEGESGSLYILTRQVFISFQRTSTMPTNKQRTRLLLLDFFTRFPNLLSLHHTTRYIQIQHERTIDLLSTRRTSRYKRNGSR